MIDATRADGSSFCRLACRSSSPPTLPRRTRRVGASLNLVSWSDGVEIVRDNIARFQQRYPGVTVRGKSPPLRSTTFSTETQTRE
jgi:hypothetical protein